MEGLQIAGNASSSHVYFRARLVELSLSALPTETSNSQSSGAVADLSNLFGAGAGQRRAAAVLFDKVDERLQALLKGKEPQGAEPKADRFTPEATSDRIIDGIKGIFQAYQKQHADLSPEELVSSFFEQAKKGVSQGYDSAIGTLDKIGLLSVSGVQENAKKTIDLVHSKLDDFENFLRDQFGLSQKTVTDATASTTQNEIVAAATSTAQATNQGGSLSLAA